MKVENAVAAATCREVCVRTPENPVRRTIVWDFGALDTIADEQAKLFKKETGVTPREFRQSVQ